MMLRLIMYACCMGYGYGREKYRTGNDGTNSSSIKKTGPDEKSLFAVRRLSSQSWCFSSSCSCFFHHFQSQIFTELNWTNSWCMDV